MAEKIDLRQMEWFAPIQELYEATRTDLPYGDDVRQASRRLYLDAQAGRGIDRSSAKLASTLLSGESVTSSLNAYRQGDVQAGERLRRGIMSAAAQAIAGKDRNKVVVDVMSRYGNSLERALAGELKSVRPDSLKGIYSILTEGNVDDSLVQSVLRKVDPKVVQGNPGLNFLVQVEADLSSARQLANSDPRGGLKAVAQVARRMDQASGAEQAVAQRFLKEAQRDIGAVANSSGQRTVLGRIGKFVQSNRVGLGALAAAGVGLWWLTNRREALPDDVPPETPLNENDQRAVLLSDPIAQTPAMGLLQSRLQLNQANAQAAGQIQGGVEGAMNAQKLRSLQRMSRTEIPVIAAYSVGQGAQGMADEARRLDMMRALSGPNF